MTEDSCKKTGHLAPSLAFHTPIVAVKAEGVYVEGEDGRRYIDLTAGLASTNAGHCPPEVVKAARVQIERLIHSGCVFHSGVEQELADRLAAITPGGIDTFFFSNSGAEAVEGAIKLARYHTGRQAIISFTGGFHGRTFGALSLTTSSARYRDRCHPLLPSVFTTPYPYCYRCPMGQKRDRCSLECFSYLERVLKHQVSASEVACAVIEPVLGEGGYVVPPAEFIQRLRELCTKEGILLVADEVQTGFGRTGSWFACEHFGVVPDIMTMAKGIASGFPLSAVASTGEIMSKWAPGAHGTTFGGNPVSCAAAVATIDKIRADGLLENAVRVGSYATGRLCMMQEKHPFIGDVRSLGLMIGAEIIKEDGGPDRGLLGRIMKKCLDAGLIIIECGSDKNIARVMPALTITETEMKEALDIFEEALV